MKGFKNTTRTISGHSFPSSAGFRSSAIPMRKTRFADGGTVGGLDESPEHERGENPNGNAQVLRQIPTTEQERIGGGKTPLNPSYAAGGLKKEKHFHVHNHYHNGKKLPGKSKLKKMQMMAEGGSTGGTRDKFAKGGKKSPQKKAVGGHIHDDTSIPAGSPDYATGGTINCMNAGGSPYGGMAGGGGIPAAPGAGATPQMPVRGGGPNLANLARIAAARGMRGPMPGRAVPGRLNAPPAPISPPMMRAKGGRVSRRG